MVFPMLSTTAGVKSPYTDSSALSDSMLNSEIDRVSFHTVQKIDM